MEEKLHVNAVNMGIDHVSSSYIASVVLKLFASITSQHHKLWPNDHNIVGCNMLHVFCHPVVTCCDMLHVGCCWLKFENC